jgi:hypothetical protein
MRRARFQLAISAGSFSLFITIASSRLIARTPASIDASKRARAATR